MFNFKDRKIEFVLYPEDERHLSSLELIKSSGYKYCGILHDKDTDGNGDFLKPHYHLVVFGFSNPLWASSLCSRFQVDINTVSKISSLRSSLRYLIHLDTKDKFRYSPDCVFGNSLDDFELACQSDLSEPEKVALIFDQIQLHYINNFSELFNFCIQNFLLKSLRSYYSLFKDVLIEKNPSLKRSSVISYDDLYSLLSDLKK